MSEGDADQGARLTGTPEAERMVVSASSEAQPPTTRTAPPASPGQCSSSTSGDATELAVQEDATSGSSVVRGLLSCSSCNVLLRHGECTPKLLTGCLHTVCAPCAQQCSSAGFQCQLCMTSSPSLLDHPLVEELLQRQHEEQRSRLCGQCAERGGQAAASGTCTECSTDLCNVCIQAHRVTKPTWGHNIDVCQDSCAQQQCSSHYKTFDNYCDTCNTLGCGECILSAHRSHQSCTLLAKDAEVKETLKTRLAGMRELRSTLEKRRASLQERVAEAETEMLAALDRITALCKQQQEILKGYFSRQLEVAQLKYNVYKRELLGHLNNVTLMEMRLAHLDSFAQQLMENGRPLTLINNSRHVIGITKRLKSVDMNPKMENKLPKLQMRRVVPFDRIGDMMCSCSYVLFDGAFCIQPVEKSAFCKALLDVTHHVLTQELNMGSDFGFSFLRLLFQTICNLEPIRPELLKMINVLHTRTTLRARGEPDAGRGPTPSTPALQHQPGAAAALSGTSQEEEQELSLDKEFRVPLGRKRMLSDDEDEENDAEAAQRRADFGDGRYR
ncbi:E3 ubiquitin-protein ligase TRIM33-like [Pollicipes pollicipes]|uniref:E3 ubiquitin-protein ligase TRIM33-like n=1 Tax=Pollicipes pollicipes TaxID=41117 RepID=UPI0018855882|nr:E3 ubiquitin-protein ligase TRIM33-like [Pollicipes pollicipes]